VTAPGGALDILRFNARFYALSALAALLALAAAAHAPTFPARAALLACAALTLLFTATSLCASHVVYVRSALRGWDWLPARLPRAPRRWVVVHAGLDGASEGLRRLWPQAAGLALDVHAAAEATEPAIARARALRPAPRPLVRAGHAALPLAPGALDLAVLHFAAHELRRAPAREALFAELARALAPGGSLLLVEHLRDLPNLLAFGPGALHFLARREWLRVAGAAGLAPRDEWRITPFVRVFRFAGAA